MAVLVQLAFQASSEDYDKVQTALNVVDDPPKGFIIHTAAVDGDKINVTDVWESAEDFGAFAQGRLSPTVTEVLGDDGPSAPEPTITELHNVDQPG